MEKVEWDDVQGLLRSGFPDLKYAAYVLWRFVPGSASKHAWLEGLAGRLTRAEDGARPKPPDEVPDQPLRSCSAAAIKKLFKEKKRDGSAQGMAVGAVNLALTASGLTALGVEEPELTRFSLEFREGMAPRPPDGAAVARRSNVLGDIGDDSPAHWEWGGWKDNETIHGVLLLYATDEESLSALVQSELGLMKGAAEPFPTLNGRLDLKEHFGFRDGISQPAIKGTEHWEGMGLKQARISAVAPGEFVLGYLNERGARMTFASAPAPQARHHGAAKTQSRDLGRNGTYLVFRQLEQNVQAFNAFISATAKLVYGPLDVEAEKEARQWVAARLIGRKPSGEPLIPAAADSPDTDEKRNDFLYYFEDRLGLACPIGAHIRRANPRDALGPDPDTALRLSKMHRIIRRGRLYGERVSDELLWAVTEDAARDPPAGGRGLYFICLNADIAGQFEMIQHSWLNGRHFGSLFGETDSMSHYPAGGSALTIQHRPTNMRIPVPKFVTVRGGAYFFLPGIRALRSLARQPPAEVAPSSVASLSGS